MRKIYSLVLMTAMLLVGTNVWATLHDTKSASDEVQITTITYDLSDPSNPVESTRTTLYGTLDEAVATTINDAATDSVQIKLLKTVTRSESVGFFGGRVELNLDTFRILMPATYGFNTVVLFKGILHIKANKADGHQGSIICEKSGGNGVNTGAAIEVLGSTVDTPNYSVLKVDENVYVSGGDRGVYLYVIENNTRDRSTTPYTSGTRNQSTIINANPDYIYPVDNSIPRTSHDACGAVIEIMRGAYVYGGQKGVQVTGSINNKTCENLPRVHVANGAVIEAGKDATCSGIYAAGYAIYLIEGTVTGATGVYVKGGQVTINGATISSNAEDYSGSNYRDGRTSSGTDAAGSAVIIEGTTNSNYAGGSLVVTGDATLESTYGYAVEGLNFNENDLGASKIDSIKIKSGTIDGGNQGVINFTQGVADNVVQQGSITGGTYNGDVTDYLGDNTGIITQTTDEQGNTIWAVTEGDPKDFKNSLIGASETDLVKQKTDVELNADVKVQYLAVQSNAVITIPDTYTLTAGEIVMSPTSKIIVEAGGSLVINGAQGIIANQASNIELHAQEGKPSIFLLNPAVTSNKTPKATVEFVSKSYRNDAQDKVFQRFGIPTGAALESITSSDTYESQFGVLNNSWETLGFINPTGTHDPLDASQLNKPFGYYQILTNHSKDEPNTIFTMTGSLNGNTSPVLNVGDGWVGFSNGYMAKLGLEAFCEALWDANEAGSTIEPTIYTYQATSALNKTLTWEAVNIYALQYVEIEPMQAFLVVNRGANTTMQMDYDSYVWGYYFPSSGAPRRVNTNNNMTRAYITVTGADSYDKVVVLESDEFTGAYESGKDAEKYMNEAVNIYVKDEMNLNILATNDLNNSYLGFSCVEAGEYTLSFGNLNGKELTLVDLETNAQVLVSESNSYQFTVGENYSNDYRFKIISRQEMPTDIETVDNTEVKKGGIYTITGQYMGEMNAWNTLPAGLYIVNGEKKVK